MTDSATGSGIIVWCRWGGSCITSCRRAVRSAIVPVPGSGTNRSERMLSIVLEPVGAVHFHSSIDLLAGNRFERVVDISVMTASLDSSLRSTAVVLFMLKAVDTFRQAVGQLNARDRLDVRTCRFVRVQEKHLSRSSKESDGADIWSDAVTTVTDSVTVSEGLQANSRLVGTEAKAVNQSTRDTQAIEVLDKVFAELLWLNS
jgi:hypothetical protein